MLAAKPHGSTQSILELKGSMHRDSVATTNDLSVG